MLLLWSPLVCLMAYAFYRATYNRYFHPLRRIPGPFWGSISDFFLLWIISTKEVHTLGLKAHKKYGSLVRAGPNFLSINDPLLLPIVYHRKVDKTISYTHAAMGDIAPPFQTIKHEDHAAKRKRIAPAFSLTNLTKLESLVDERTIEWISALRNRFATTGMEMDFAAWSQWFAYDTISHLSFGAPIGFVQEAHDIENLITSWHNMAPMEAIIVALPWLMKPILEHPLSRRYLIPKPGDKSGSGKIMAFRDKLLKERLNGQRSEHKGDFLDNILAAKNEDGSSISLEEVKTESLVLMVAATDTTAALFCGFVRYVTENTRVYDKLIAEIDEYDRQGRLSSPVAKYAEIATMPYFGAVHKEVLRIMPPTPFNLPRVVSEPGLTINGHYIPAGSEIGANPYVIQRDRKMFGEDADNFRPERWLEDEERTRRMDKYSLVWGYGSRTCVGKNIALLETYKLLLEFFRNFKPAFVDSNNIWKQANLALLVHWDMWITIKEHRHK